MLDIILIILYITSIIMSYLMIRAAVKEGSDFGDLKTLVCLIIAMFVPIFNILFSIWLYVDEIDYEKLIKRIFFVKDK